MNESYRQLLMEVRDLLKQALPICVMKKLFRRFVCKIMGHHYPTLTFTSNVLYFCSRCGKEMFDRTFDDLEPMSEDERDAFLDDLDREEAGL